MPDILFVKTSSLGDVVHQMPAMTDARRQFPDARIAWIIEEAFAPLARLHPGVDEVIPVATRRWRHQLLNSNTWREIGTFKTHVRSVEAQTVIDTQGLIRSAIIAKMSGGTRHGYDRASIREAPATIFYDVKHRVSRTLHAVTRNRLLTGLSLGYEPEAAIDYGLRQLIEGKRSAYALLFHGTSNVEKEWGNDEWIKVGQWLTRQGLEVLLPWGNAREFARCRHLAEMIPGARILERMSIDAIARMTASASCAIGVDTGLLQLAAACEVPLAAIFVATQLDLTGPIGNGPIANFGGKGKSVSADEVILALEQKSMLPRP
jgi:heptosyltransferase-1